MTFLPSGEKLTIRQEFKGTDEQDHLVVTTTLNGQIPEVPPGTSIQSEPYTEIYQYSSNRKTQSLTLQGVFIVFTYQSILCFSDHLILHSELQAGFP